MENSKKLKSFIITIIIIFIFMVTLWILLELRIIQKPYKWIVFDVIRNKYTTYDKDNDVLNYNSDKINIEIEHIVKDEFKIEMWVATVKINDPSQLKSAFAGNEFTSDKKERTSSIAKKNNAVLAIDGAAVGFNENGVVIRNGVTYRTTSLDCPALLIDKNGDFKIFDTREETLEQIDNLEILQAFDFGPVLIKDGEIGSAEGDWYETVKDPRTAIGQKGELEYVILIANGRSKKSEGISMYDAAVELQNRGCYIGYNLDGGGSTTLYFNGEVLNNPSDIIGERRISDILYFKEN